MPKLQLANFQRPFNFLSFFPAFWDGKMISMSSSESSKEETGWSKNIFLYGTFFRFCSAQAAMFGLWRNRNIISIATAPPSFRQAFWTWSQKCFMLRTRFEFQNGRWLRNGWIRAHPFIFSSGSKWQLSRAPFWIRWRALFSNSGGHENVVETNKQQRIHWKILFKKYASPRSLPAKVVFEVRSRDLRSELCNWEIAETERKGFQFEIPFRFSVLTPHFPHTNYGLGIQITLVLRLWSNHSFRFSYFSQRFHSLVFVPRQFLGVKLREKCDSLYFRIISHSFSRLQNDPLSDQKYDCAQKLGLLSPHSPL